MISTMRAQVFACFSPWFVLLPFPILNSVGRAQETPRSFGENTAPAVKLCDLLYFKSVRQSLNVSEETFDFLQKALAPIRDAAPSYEAFRDSTFEGRMRSTEPMLEKAQKMDESVWTLLSEILPPDQMMALMGGHIQRNGVEGLFNRRICQTLSIQGDQLEKMIASVNAERSRRRKVLAEVANQEANKTSVRSLILRDEPLLAAAIETLGDTQRKRLQQMLDSGKTIVPEAKRFTFGW